MQPFKYLLLLGLGSILSTKAYAYEALDCKELSRKDRSSCSVCFDGGKKKLKEVFRPNMTFNASLKNANLYFDDENKVTYKFQSLNKNTSWFVSNNLLQYPDEFVWNNQEKGEFSGRKFHYFPKGSKQRIFETKPGKGIRLQEIRGQLNKSWDFKFTFQTKYRDFVSTEKLGKKRKHQTCIFYKALE